MMRLPPFGYLAPKTAAEAARALEGEGPSAAVVAGGTDLFPNMKRRHQTPTTLVSVGRIHGMRGIRWEEGGGLVLGAAERLRTLERSPEVRQRLGALWTAVRSIATPLIRNTGTVGGNVCLDTRCNYYDQTYEWRRAIQFCMKCEGDTCWVAPSSPRCWAVNSSDTVPVLIALGARAHLQGPGGERAVALEGLFRDDGIEYLDKRRDEVLVRLEIPAQGSARSTYRKVRRRGAFDFPVLGVAARLVMDEGRVAEARIVLNGVGSAPIVCEEASRGLVGLALTDEAIETAAKRAYRPAKPLDNTDHEPIWRKRMARIEVRRALAALRDEAGRPPGAV